MPFDALPDVNTKPNLAHLSHVLRHRELWPAGFEWDYRSCKHCAMGLAGRLYAECCHKRPTVSSLACSFGIERPVASHIFAGLGGWRGLIFKGLVTPEQVADAIDARLASDLHNSRHVNNLTLQ